MNRFLSQTAIASTTRNVSCSQRRRSSPLRTRARSAGSPGFRKEIPYALVLREAGYIFPPLLPKSAYPPSRARWSCRLAKWGLRWCISSGVWPGRLGAPPGKEGGRGKRS